MEDLRGWLDKMGEQGQVKTIEGAHWDKEIGCLSALNVRKKGSTALLFDHIPGYPVGYRVATCTNNNARTLAHTFNLAPTDSDEDMVNAFREKFSNWEASWQKFPPRKAKTGPILETVQSGSDIDILHLPVPKWHEADGGRYIGTGDAVITRDPDTGHVNLGTYRIMVHDSKTVGIHPHHGSHARSHLEKYHAQGKPAPVAVSVGHHPLIFRIASLPLPPGAEYGFIGAVMQEPVPVLVEEVTGLPIPANSEIVLAGWCPPGVLRDEGPFGEFTGYYGLGHESGKNPVIQIERVYFRHSPILLGAPPNRVYYESTYAHIITRSALLHNALESNGVPAKRVWFQEATGGGSFMIISIKQEYAGHARRAGLVASQAEVGAHIARWVIVVDEDIDPTDTSDVLWAIGTRLDPEKGIQILPRCRGSHIDPMLRKPVTALFKTMVILDACKPYEWKDEFPPAIDISPDLEHKVRERWGAALGL